MGERKLLKNIRKDAEQEWQDAPESIGINEDAEQSLGKHPVHLKSSVSPNEEEQRNGAMGVHRDVFTAFLSVDTKNGLITQEIKQ